MVGLWRYFKGRTEDLPPFREREVQQEKSWKTPRFEMVEREREMGFRVGRARSALWTCQAGKKALELRGQVRDGKRNVSSTGGSERRTWYVLGMNTSHSGQASEQKAGPLPAGGMEAPPPSWAVPGELGELGGGAHSLYLDHLYTHRTHS